MYWKKLKKENITRKEQEEAKKKIEYISNRNPSQVQIVLFHHWTLYLGPEKSGHAWLAEQLLMGHVGLHQ